MLRSDDIQPGWSSAIHDRGGVAQLIAHGYPMHIRTLVVTVCVGEPRRPKRRSGSDPCYFFPI
jgi:hypothetical protein